MGTTNNSQMEFMNGIIEWLLKASNSTEDEAYDFALVAWQHREFLQDYLNNVLSRDLTM